MLWDERFRGESEFQLQNNLERNAQKFNGWNEFVEFMEFVELGELRELLPLINPHCHLLGELARSPASCFPLQPLTNIRARSHHRKN
jgi:hypothetical protein